MLFPTNSKIHLNKDELVKVVLYEGDVLYGFVDQVDGDVVWLRAGQSPDSKLARFNLKIDQIIKLN